MVKKSHIPHSGNSAIRSEKQWADKVGSHPLFFRAMKSIGFHHFETSVQDGEEAPALSHLTLRLEHWL